MNGTTETLVARIDSEDRRRINFEDRASLPTWLADLESFRQWTRSESCPESGWYSWLDGDFWVDLSMEELFSHNQVKAAISLTLLRLVQELAIGRFVPDRMRLTHPAANLSTEPDGLFFTWDAMRTGRIRPVEGTADNFIELEGSPDLVLEIVSRTSFRKDTVTLRELYRRAGIPEYWLVDARKGGFHFSILRHSSEGYRPVEDTDGWLYSSAFDREFRFEPTTDPLGYPLYTLHVRGAAS